MNKLYVIRWYYHDTDLLLYVNNTFSKYHAEQIMQKNICNGWHYELVRNDDSQMVWDAR